MGRTQLIDDSTAEHIPALKLFALIIRIRHNTMRFASIGLAAALALSSTFALAQSGGTVGGSSKNGITGSTTGKGNGAGNVPVTTPSYLNPSGNSLINPSPSGSTLMQPPPYAAPGPAAPAPR